MLERLLIIYFALSATSVTYAEEKLMPKCQRVAEDAAAKADNKMFGAEASSCGSKLLHLGDQLETYLVCVSDETDPSEWIVAVERTVTDKNGRVVQTCKVDYTGYAVDAATPDFDDKK